MTRSTTAWSSPVRRSCSSLSENFRAACVRSPLDSAAGSPGSPSTRHLGSFGGIRQDDLRATSSCTFSRSFWTLCITTGRSPVICLAHHQRSSSGGIGPSSTISRTSLRSGPGSPGPRLQVHDFHSSSGYLIISHRNPSVSQSSLVGASPSPQRDTIVTHEAEDCHEPLRSDESRNRCSAPIGPSTQVSGYPQQFRLYYDI